MSPKIEKKTVVAGGFTTGYLELGDRANPTVVLIHDGGFGADGALSWGEVAEILSKRFHVLAPDLLGWGDSDKVVFLDRAPYPPRIAHVAAFLEELEVEEAFFAGASFGGSLLVRATTDPARPWPVRGAVSITGAGGLYRYPEGVAALADYEEPSIESARRFVGYVIDPEWEGFEGHVRERYEASLAPGHWEVMMAPRLKNPKAIRPKFDDPFPASLANTATPIMFVEGSKDRLLEPGWAGKLAELGESVSSLVVPASHEPNIDQPELTADFLAAFFDRVAAEER